LASVRKLTEIRAKDGATARRDGDAIVLEDAEGRLLLRYEGGVLVVGGAGDVAVRAAGKLVLEGQEVEVRAAVVARTAAPIVETVAGRTSLVAEEAKTEVERWELVASRVVENARDVFRDVADLYHQRIGKARTVVKELWSLRAGRTVIKSKEETQVDGKKVLLG
jgi:hypothetical protein